MEKKEIFSKLLVKEDFNQKDLEEIAELSSEFIKISERNKELYLIEIDKYKIEDKILIYLIGIWILNELGEDKNITGNNIAESIYEKRSSISLQLLNLKKDKKILYENNFYKINKIKIKEILKKLKNVYSTDKKNSIENKVSQIKKNRKTKFIKKRTNTKIQKKQISIENEKVSNEDREKNLKELEINKEDFETIYNEKEKTLFLREVKGQNGKEKSIKSLFLFLIGCHIIYKNTEIASNFIRENLKNSGLVGSDLQNLSTFIKDFKEYILHNKGEKGNTNTFYKLTQKGINEGKKLLKDYITGENSFNIIKINKNNLKQKSLNNFKIEIDKIVLEDNLNHFIKINDLNRDKILTNFEIETNSLRILTEIKENKRKLKQIKALLFLGTLLKEIYKIGNFDSTILLKDSHLPTERLDHLYSNKKLFQKFFLTKNHISNMSLNYSGIEEGKKIIKEICNNE